MPNDDFSSRAFGPEDATITNVSINESSEAYDDPRIIADHTNHAMHEVEQVINTMRERIAEGYVFEAMFFAAALKRPGQGPDEASVVTVGAGLLDKIVQVTLEALEEGMRVNQNEPQVLPKDMGL